MKIDKKLLWLMAILSLQLIAMALLARGVLVSGWSSWRAFALLFNGFATLSHVALIYIRVKEIDDMPNKKPPELSQ